MLSTYFEDHKQLFDFLIFTPTIGKEPIFTPTIDKEPKNCRRIALRQFNSVKTEG